MLTRTQEIDSTVGIMRDNINKVSERGARLDSLQDKTDNLAQSAQGFRRGANRVRKQMWWKDMKMRMCLIVGIVILLLIIIVPSGASESRRRLSNGLLTSHSLERAGQVVNALSPDARNVYHINCKGKWSGGGAVAITSRTVSSTTRLCWEHVHGEMGAMNWILSCLSLHSNGQLAAGTTLT
jgi:hypothetical protein